MLTYNELQDLCEKKRITATFVAESAELSLGGLRKGMIKESLSARTIVIVCSVLGITPNEFFGVETQSAGDTVYGDQQKGAKKQIIYKESEELKQTIQMLRDQLKAKDEQIAAKDQQINKLLGL